MPEGITPENLFHNIMDSLADNVPKQKSVSFFEEDKSNSVSSKFNRLFGRQKPVHRILGGGKSADVLLWRNKKISAGVLTAATAIWVLFEWLNYNFLPLLCFALVIVMVAQFFWSTFLNRSEVPRLVISNEVVVNIATLVGTEVNHVLALLQNIACGGNIKQLLSLQLPVFLYLRDSAKTGISGMVPHVIILYWVVGGLLAAAMIGSCCNFLTVLFIGFVAAHTLPVLYERYDDQVDNFVNNLLGHAQHHYGKLDASVLSRIPKGNLKWKKSA